jgi:hypothetical protein
LWDGIEISKNFKKVAAYFRRAAAHGVASALSRDPQLPS